VGDDAPDEGIDMTQMYGISVIDDSQASQQSDEIGIGITAIVRIKHAALYEAAKVMGSASALARHLGLQPTILGEWINLKACPPKEYDPAMPAWTEERIAVMEAKLLELTGKTWDELWPDELRENHEFLKAPKSIEKVFNWKQAALLSYAHATRDRLLENAGIAKDEHPDADMQRDAVEKSLHLLTLRERRVLEMRYGFKGNPHTLDEAGAVLQITRTRVQQIEKKALNKLRYYASLSMFPGVEQTTKIQDEPE
jgi:RNA polymerase sigma factor (sigma-70 family)